VRGHALDQTDPKTKSAARTLPILDRLFGRTESRQGPPSRRTTGNGRRIQRPRTRRVQRSRRALPPVHTARAPTIAMPADDGTNTESSSPSRTAPAGPANHRPNVAPNRAVNHIETADLPRRPLTARHRGAAAPHPQWPRTPNSLALSAFHDHSPLICQTVRDNFLLMRWTAPTGETVHACGGR
jgi:hypothetical protein